MLKPLTWVIPFSSLKSPVIVSSPTSSKQGTSGRVSDLSKVTRLPSGNSPLNQVHCPLRLLFPVFSPCASLRIIQQNSASWFLLSAFVTAADFFELPLPAPLCHPALWNSPLTSGHTVFSRENRFKVLCPGT